jgi:hypothetical protein
MTHTFKKLFDSAMGEKIGKDWEKLVYEKQIFLAFSQNGKWFSGDVPNHEKI